MARILLSFIAFLFIFSYAPASIANDIDVAKRGVVRVVIVEPNPRGQIKTPQGNFAVISTGSGFAVGKDKIVTNHHVIERSLSFPRRYFAFVVPSAGKKFYIAKIEKWDRGADLALLTANDSNFPPLSIYTGALKSGSYVAALGYPGNIDRQTISRAEQFFIAREPTVSSGSYSNVQNVGPMKAIVHDANIARGNSGGPLVDECGRVLGVNTQQTDNFRGDSAFAFASATSELTGFLRSAQQQFSNIAEPCVTAEQFAALETARVAQEKAQADRDAAEAERQKIEDDKKIEQKRLNAERVINEEREQKFFISIILIVVGSLCAIAGIVILLSKEANKKMGIALLSGAFIFMIGAIIIFLMRPSLVDASSLTIDDESQTSQDEAEDISFKTSSDASIVGREGKYICTLKRGAGRITTSSVDDVPLTWTDSGCVNGNKQYAPSDEGIWSRILVPNESATVSLLEFNPDKKSLTINKYALGLDAIETARDVRSRINVENCTINESSWDVLAEQQQEILDVLPDTSNEKLVYDCQFQP